MTDIHNGHVLPASTLFSLRALQGKIGEANAANGWHDRTRRLAERAKSGEAIFGDLTSKPQEYTDRQADLTDHWVATLALLDTEVSEAIEELRNGRAVNETYYSGGGLDDVLRLDPRTGDLRKPEGVPSEVADVVIRALDFAARAGFDLASAIDEKLAYNATRGKMHGGKKL